MDDLAHLQAGHRHRHVGPVGAHAGASLAYRSAAQAAAFLAGLAIGADVAPLAQHGLDAVGAAVAGRVEVHIHPDDGLNRLGGACDGLHHGARALLPVADYVDAGHAALQGVRVHYRPAPAVQGQAVGLVQGAVHLLPHGGNHRSGGQLHRLSGIHRAAPARGVGGAQLHHRALQLSLRQADGGQQLHELDAVRHGQLQLLLVGGHVPLGAAVDQAHVLHAGDALGRPGGVHGGVASADDDHVLAQVQALGLLLGLLQELNHVDGLAVFHSGAARLPGAGGQNHVGIALIKQLLNAGNLLAQLELGPHGLAQLNVLLDGFIADAEGGDHVLHDAPQLRLGLEHGYRHSGPAQEIGGGQAPGAAAHYGYLLAGYRRARLQLGQQLGEPALGGLQLPIAYLHRFLVIAPHALVHAAVGADGAGDEGQGVALEDHLQRFLVLAVGGQAQVGGNVLLNGTAAPAGRGKAVHQGHLCRQLLGGNGLHRLAVMAAGAGLPGDAGNPLHVHPGPGALAAHHLLADLGKALVAAGLEHVGGHGDGPDARPVQRPHREDVRAAGIGDAQLALELAGQLLRQRGAQGEQGPARHVHLLAGQFPCRHVHREGVGQLHPEVHPSLLGQLDQPAQHGDGVLHLQVLPEVMVVELDVVVAQVVQGLAGEFIAQQGGVALDVGVQPLLGNQIGGDALDFVGRAAVEGGFGDGAGNLGRDAHDVIPVHMAHPVQVGQGPVHAFLPYGGAGGVLHALDELVHLFALDALQVVAHAHVEHEGLRIAQLQLIGH